MPTRPPRVRRHDPAHIDSLLSRRDAEGISFARLAAESGIPVGTLAYSSWRRRQLAAVSPAFAEVVVRSRPAACEPARGGLPMFELALANGRRLTIAAGFESDDLRRLLAIAEATSC